jgi:exopolysaccharide production protein ExoY
MLVRMPRGPVDENRARVREECDPFEAALRRDLASTPVVSYESAIGGWAKRAFDIAVTAVTAPAWLVLMFVAVSVAKLRHRERVIVSDERIGYGGIAYQCFHLRLDSSVDGLVAPAAQGEAAANDLAAISQRAEDQRAKWRHALERLPQLFNVLRGDMSLVGPGPLVRADVEPLKTAKRYYLSARPGVIGVKGLVGEAQERAAQYKVYSLCWSLMTDVSLLLIACVSLHKRGELWKPGRTEHQIAQSDEVAARRRARAEGRISV